MLKIESGKPWIMWPDIMANNFIDNPANKVFDSEGDFKFIIIFELEEPVKEKGTLFAKLPSYFGFDLEDYGFMLIVTEKDTDPEYITINFEWELNKKYELIVKKISGVLSVTLNEVTYITKFLKKGIAGDPNSHIIFGSGNFPKNGFNLNYREFTVHEMEIFKDGDLICQHDFKEFVFGKYVDVTGNCNFIHKI